MFFSSIAFNKLLAQTTIDGYLSNKFTVFATSEKSESKNLPVFMSESSNAETKNLKASWANIPIKGKTVISIATKGEDVQHIIIRPKQYNIKYSIEKNKILLTINKPQKIALEINGDETHPLYLFADPIEKNIPKPNSKGIVYFAPGFHAIGNHFQIKSNTTYYLASGAYLKGNFYAAGIVENVVFSGRGIIDAGDHKWQNPLQGLRSNIVFEDGRNVRIEGITLINAGNFQFKLQTKVPDTKIVFRNMNMIGWNKNTDGIHISDMDWKDNKQIGNAPRTTMLVEDCFIRANDDAVLLCDGVADATVKNSVFVDDGYGATFCLSWGAHQPMKKVRVSDCYVIRKKKQNPVFRANHAGESHLQNIEFKNIYIDGDVECLVGLQIMAHQYDPDKEFGSISNIRFRNVFLEGKVKENWIIGLDKAHGISNVVFQNLVINGKHITSLQEGNFKTNEFVYNIQFK